jgi:hypothetical protein
MFTRGYIPRNVWGQGTGGTGGTGAAAPHVPGWRAGVIVGAGEVPMLLPPRVVMMDPSDRTTWTQPVRWT